MTVTFVRSLASYTGSTGIGDETGYIVAFMAKNPDQAQPNETVLVNQGMAGGDANIAFFAEVVLWGGDVALGESPKPAEIVSVHNTGS